MINKLNKNKGITLVALVVTIVVLLILAGVSINLVVGQNGIIKKAQDAKKNYTDASEKEKQGLENIDSWIEKEMLSQMEKISVNNKAKANGTIDGEAPTAMNPIIPKGYIPINQGEAVWGDGTSTPAETSVNKGLVIKDESGNEWVWVPVPNPSELYVKEAVTITQGGVNVTTQNYTKSEILPNVKRGTPNSTDYREPGIVHENDGNTTYLQQAGFTTLQDMADNLVKDYNEMILSLRKYNGFYIGRYELSAQGEKKGGTVGGQNWYTAYKQAKNIIPNEATGIVETRMIWGLQWDATCKWLDLTGIDINDSSNYGNYSGSKLAGGTGSNEMYKVNNIYDLAGNYWELMQEAYGNNGRVRRGGSYIGSGSNNPVSDKYYLSSSVSSEHVSSRSALYIK